MQHITLTEAVKRAMLAGFAKHGQSRFGVVAAVQAAPEGFTQINGLYRLDWLAMDVAAAAEAHLREVAKAAAAEAYPVEGANGAPTAD